MDITEQLEELFQQKESGLISEYEYEAKKAELLAQQKNGPAPFDLSVKEIYKSYWLKSFTWRGRACRSEYWWPWFISLLIGVVTNVVLSVFSFLPNVVLLVCGIVWFLFSLANLFPSWAVTARRYHDLGKSAWFAFIPVWCLLVLVLLSAVFGVFSGIVGAAQSGNVASNVISGSRLFVFMIGGLVYGIVNIIWSYVFPCLKGQPQANKYGDPR